MVRCPQRPEGRTQPHPRIPRNTMHLDTAGLCEECEDSGYESGSTSTSDSSASFSVPSNSSDSRSIWTPGFGFRLNDC